MSPTSPAFTLIELLVVISIIAMVAALVVQAGRSAGMSKRRAVVEADKTKIVHMIEDYKATLNFYPPDNGQLATTNTANYDSCAAVNPLFYELTGASNNWPTNGNALVYNGTIINLSNYQAAFNRGGVANCDAQNPHNFFSPPPQPNEYTANPNGFLQLAVPVDLVPGTNQPNFWHYDSSSPLRHNPNSYDLWAEYEVGVKNGQVQVLTNYNTGQ